MDTHQPLPSRKIRFAPPSSVHRPLDVAPSSPAAKTTSLPSSPSPLPGPKPSSTWPRPTKNLLQAFRKGNNTPASSTDSLTPTPSFDSASDTTWGTSLQRWSSGSSAAPSIGSPLARTQSQSSTASSAKRSIFSLGGSTSGSIKGKKPKPRAGSLPNPFANSVATKRGTRMLNGRVYGAKNADGTHNPFGNARDEPESEFVEWGYGGMGSVRHGVGSSAWSRVQAGGSNSTTPRTKAPTSGAVHVGMGVVGDGDEDGDDGSGMAWVRRRREAREREARERAEKEKTEAEAADPITEDQQPQPGDSTPTLTEAAPLSSSPIQSPALLAPDPPPVVADPPAEEHILSAVTLPAGFRGHHGHGHHRSSSDALGIADTKLTDESPLSSSAASTASSDSEDESDDEGDGADDDDDVDADEEEQKRRATALGAGVEKVSRHKD
ncbi:hypothetical protein HMN09_00110400 [Mycena chlorophos]|uniref:Uncharacterized protein n=1 Tax=Mycena chlorophos TaxID=658473 RepID=A0A8H6WN26_MYCCL|nr:hypothetical protein HMN09_00110400 [Mycena chlorophos]